MVAAIAVRVNEAELMPDHPMFGFTPADRDVLTTLKVELSFLSAGIRELSGRIGKLEDSRVSMHDLEEIYADVDTLRTDAKELVRRVETLEQWRWKIVGGAAAVVALLEVFFKLIK
jgi:ubiquinone biosynthesis protein UbiJ